MEKVEKKAAAGDSSPKAGAGEGLSDFMSSFSAVRTALYWRTTRFLLPSLLFLRQGGTEWFDQIYRPFLNVAL
jgi:hypothetical protein